MYRYQVPGAGQETLTAASLASSGPWDGCGVRFAVRQLDGVPLATPHVSTMADSSSVTWPRTPESSCSIGENGGPPTLRWARPCRAGSDSPMMLGSTDARGWLRVRVRGEGRARTQGRAWHLAVVRRRKLILSPPRPSPIAGSGLCPARNVRWPTPRPRSGEDSWLAIHRGPGWIVNGAMDKCLRGRCLGRCLPSDRRMWL